jgi:hypothetical protein
LTFGFTIDSASNPFYHHTHLDWFQSARCAATSDMAKSEAQRPERRINNPSHARRPALNPTLGDVTTRTNHHRPRSPESGRRFQSNPGNPRPTVLDMQVGMPVSTALHVSVKLVGRHRSCFQAQYRPAKSSRPSHSAGPGRTRSTQTASCADGTLRSGPTSTTRGRSEFHSPGATAGLSAR